MTSQVDGYMQSVIKDLSTAAEDCGSKIVEQVLSVSSNFISEEAHAELQNFYDLYGQ